MAHCLQHLRQRERAQGHAFALENGVRDTILAITSRRATMAQCWLFPMKRFIFLTGLLAFSLPLSAAEEAVPPIRVAVYDGPGAGTSRADLVEVLGAAKGGIKLQMQGLSPAAIRSGSLKDFDVLIHPGGSGGGQAKALEAEGREAVRDFVRKGGGFIGICAGAYLATDDYDWSLGLIEARVVDRRHWARGKGSVEVELSPAARDFFGAGAENISIFYAQGPLLSRREWDNPDAPDYESLGIYRTGIAEKGAPEGIMPGTSAIVRSTFEEGRVFLFSPHPELTDGLGSMVERAVQWTAKREPPAAAPAPEMECAEISAVMRKPFLEDYKGGVAVLVLGRFCTARATAPGTERRSRLTRRWGSPR